LSKQEVSLFSGDKYRIFDPLSAQGDFSNSGRQRLQHHQDLGSMSPGNRNFGTDYQPFGYGTQLTGDKYNPI